MICLNYATFDYNLFQWFNGNEGLRKINFRKTKYAVCQHPRYIIFER